MISREAAVHNKCRALNAAVADPACRRWWAPPSLSLPQLVCSLSCLAMLDQISSGNVPMLGGKTISHTWNCSISVQSWP